MELAVALAPAMNAESCTLFYRLLRPQLKVRGGDFGAEGLCFRAHACLGFIILQSTDETLQKKSYKALYEICSGNTPTLREFTGQHLSEIAVS